MKKKLTILVAVLVVLGGIGYGVYRVGMNMASDKLMNTVTKQMEQSGELDQIKKSITNDPNLKKAIENDPKLKALIAEAKADSNGSSADPAKSGNTGHSKVGAAGTTGSTDSKNGTAGTLNNTNSKDGKAGTAAKSGNSGSGVQAQSSNSGGSDIQKLPFNTKEGAAQVLISKIGLSELKRMYSGVKSGTMTKAQVIAELKSKLSPEEITALKLVAYQEATK